jgi:hypothetical protein
MEKLINELKKAIDKMEDLRKDYNLSSNALAAEACENCILHLKRAIANGLYEDDIKLIDELIYPIASNIVSGNEISRKANVAELAYNLRNHD